MNTRTTIIICLALLATKPLSEPEIWHAESQDGDGYDVAAIEWLNDMAIETAYTDAEIDAHAGLFERAEKERAEHERLGTVAMVWNITPENIDSYREWW